MSLLLEIQEKVHDTNAAIARMERAVATHGESPSLLASIRSLEKRRKFLEAEFLELADRYGQDVCTYRLFANGEQPSITALSKALGDFQLLFSVVYDSLKTGPKDRARIGADVANATNFGFAYTFPGSIGVVLTLPNARLLPTFKTDLDRTVETVFEISQAKAPAEICVFAKQLGPASVRAAYRWAKDHAMNHLGAEIEWRRNQAVTDRLLIQHREIEQLSSTIEQTSEESTEEIVVGGVLVGADTLRHTFHFVTDVSIKGRFSDAISETQKAELPAPYRATIRKTTKIVYSTDEEDVAYFLLKLERPS